MLWLLAANALADPIVSDARGLRDVPFSVTLTAGNGGTLHYALDGGVPDRLYTGPIEVDRTMTLRATETFADGTVSPIVTHTWVFVDQVLTSAVMLPGIAQDPVTGPIVASSLRAADLLADGGAVEARRPLLRAQEIVLELRSTLRHDVGGDLARNLDRLYEFIYHKLLSASKNGDASAATAAATVAGSLRDSWHQACLSAVGAS